VNASDADIRFSVSDDHFAVDSNGVISSNKRLDADGNNGYYEFRVTMTVPVRIYTKNTNDEEPRFSQQVYTTAVDGNAGPNTLVTSVLAHDKDGDGVTYGFFGGTNTSGLFRIDPTTGVIRLIDSQIDFDLDKYELNVTATDDGKCCMEARASVDPKEVRWSSSPKFKPKTRMTTLHTLRGACTRPRWTRTKTSDTQFSLSMQMTRMNLQDSVTKSQKAILEERFL